MKRGSAVVTELTGRSAQRSASGFEAMLDRSDISEAKEIAGGQMREGGLGDTGLSCWSAAEAGEAARRPWCLSCCQETGPGPLRRAPIR